MPTETYLLNSVITLYGGILRGLKTLNISLGGAFIAYPKAALDSGVESYFHLDSITILDGGLFKYEGKANDGDALTVELDGGLVVQGGAQVIANKLTLKGQCCSNFWWIAFVLNTS